jgi:uncharacterized protein (DUF2062 family)
MHVLHIEFLKFVGPFFTALALCSITGDINSLFMYLVTGKFIETQESRQRQKKSEGGNFLFPYVNE